MHSNSAHSTSRTIRALLFGTVLAHLVVQLTGLQCSCEEKFYNSQIGHKSDLVCRGIEPNSCEGPDQNIVCVTSQLVHKQHPSPVFQRKSCMGKMGRIRIGCNTLPVSEGAAVLYLYACDTDYCNDAGYDDICVRPSGPGAPFAIATVPTNVAEDTDRVPADRPFTGTTQPPPTIQQAKPLSPHSANNNQKYANELDQSIDNGQQRRVLPHSHNSDHHDKAAAPIIATRNTSTDHIPPAYHPPPPAQVVHPGLPGATYYSTSSTTTTITIATKFTTDPQPEPELFIEPEGPPRISGADDSHRPLINDSIDANSNNNNSDYQYDDDDHYDYTEEEKALLIDDDVQSPAVENIGNSAPLSESHPQPHPYPTDALFHQISSNKTVTSHPSQPIDGNGIDPKVAATKLHVSTTASFKDSNSPNNDSLRESKWSPTINNVDNDVITDKVHSAIRHDDSNHDKANEPISVLPHSRQSLHRDRGRLNSAAGSIAEGNGGGGGNYLKKDSVSAPALPSGQISAETDILSGDSGENRFADSGGSKAKNSAESAVNGREIGAQNGADRTATVSPRIPNEVLDQKKSSAGLNCRNHNKLGFSILILLITIILFVG